MDIDIAIKFFDEGIAFVTVISWISIYFVDGKVKQYEHQKGIQILYDENNLGHDDPEGIYYTDGEDKIRWNIYNDLLLKLSLFLPFAYLLVVRWVILAALYTIDIVIFYYF
jgi:hypothetical protein